MELDALPTLCVIVIHSPPCMLSQLQTNTRVDQQALNPPEANEETKSPSSVQNSLYFLLILEFRQQTKFVEDM